jgi:hypothetical protein
MTTLDNQAQIGRKGTVVGSTSGLVVLVRSGYVVRKLSGTLLDFTLVVRLCVIFLFLGHGLHLVDGVHDTDKVTPWHTSEGVAAGADFTVNLETTAETSHISIVTRFSQ